MLFKPVLVTPEKLRESYLPAGSSACIIADNHTVIKCLPVLHVPVPENRILVIPSGEQSKNMATVMQIWDFLTRLHVQKSDMVYLLGGGVLCDTAAFALSTFKRGISYTLLPTTLLAMCDAAIGGKTGINYLGYKNLVGSFSPQAAVFICTKFLDSLPRKQWLNGYAEMLKHGIISDNNYLERLMQINQLEELTDEELIQTSIAIKYQIVSADPLEKGERKLLNFGHTIAHALEKVAQDHGFEIEHGEAVAAGMLAELKLSCNKYNISDSFVRRFGEQIHKFFPAHPWIMQFKQQIAEATNQDKKNEWGKRLLTLIKQPGTAVYNQEITDTELLECLSI